MGFSDDLKLNYIMVIKKVLSKRRAGQGQAGSVGKVLRKRERAFTKGSSFDRTPICRAGSCPNIKSYIISIRSVNPRQERAL